MRQIKNAAILSATALALAGCGGTDETIREESMQVASNLVTCQGLVERFCFMTRAANTADWTYLYERIEGFAYEWGREYTLRVQVTERPGTGLQDASSVVRAYRVLSVASASTVPAGTAFSLNIQSPQDSLAPVAGGAWSLLGVQLHCEPETCQALQSAKSLRSPVLLCFDHRNSPAGPLYLLSVEAAPK